MENERFKIFDNDRKQIGVATREEVHRIGYWHETFHCWFVSKDNESHDIYLQIRSDSKKDYPNLLDITAAGHLLEHETVIDGVREIKEELGIDVAFDELISLGVIEYCTIKENFIDKELANVFLYRSDSTLGFEDFTLQEEEVSGMVKANFQEFCELWFGERETIFITGFKIDTEGNQVWLEKQVGRDQFVTHSVSFYQTIIEKMKAKMEA